MKHKDLDIIKWEYILRYKRVEADVVYFLRKELDKLWFDLYQEVRIITKNKENNWNSRKQIWRLDIVVNKKLWIEVKLEWKKSGLSQQLKKYESYWFDMITCIWFKDIDNCVNKVIKYFDNQKQLF